MRFRLILLVAALVGSACAATEKPVEVAVSTRWITASANMADDVGKTRYYRTAFTVRPGLVKATANVWIDDRGTVRIDGQPVGGSTKDADWTQALKAAGRRMVEVEGFNVAGIGGLCLGVDLAYADGTHDHLHTSGDWEASLDGKEWHKAHVVCDALSQAWTSHRDMSVFLSRAEREAVAQESTARFTRLPDILARLSGEKKPTCRVVYERGLPRIDASGLKIETTYYNVSAGWSDVNAALRRQVAGFRDAGMHLYGLGVKVEDVWRADGSIDFAALTKPMESALTIDPEARFMFCLAQTKSPSWWNARHPDELVGYAGGEVNLKESNDIKNVATASMASEVWRTDMTDFLTRAVRYLEGTPYATRIVAYRADYGIHYEWHYYGMRDELFPDNGAAMTRAFRKWTNDPTALVPSKAERMVAPVRGLLRDPVAQARVIAYERCHAAVVRDCVLSFDKALKEACGGRCLVGNYCGYFFGMRSNPAEGWHLENDAILDSPYVDFQASPQVYGAVARSPGNPQYARCLLEGLRRRGKLALLEADNSPTVANDPYCHFSKDTVEDETLYARDFVQTLCWGCGYWYFDFGRGWYGSTFDGLWKKLYSLRAQAGDCSSASEVLVVGDYESVMFAAVPGRPLARLGEASVDLITNLGHAGIPFDTASMKDLQSGKLKEYRVYVFANLNYVTRAKLETLRALRQNGARFVFVGAETGLLTARGASEETAAKLQAWGTVVAANTPAARLRETLRDLGVHVYNEDEKASLYANAGHVALHVGRAGTHRIRLPRRRRVTQIYPTRRELGDFNEFTFTSTAAETFLFALGEPMPPVDVMADTWVATDGLGRTLPSAAEVGPCKNREVAIFYFLWHYPSRAATPGPFDMTKAFLKDPDLMKHPDSPLFGPYGCFHHWGEPLLGYYRADDPAVYRKHAQMLSDAGVDAVIFDTSNGPIYEDSWRALLDGFAEIEAAGGKAPKIAFLCPFSPMPPAAPNPRGSVVRRLWEKLYKPGMHPELWYRWKGKPLILSYPAYATKDALTQFDAIGDLSRDGAKRRAVRIEVGHSLGGVFSVGHSFAHLSISTPTWHSKTPCALTLRLRREGPGGEEVLTRRVTDIRDNQQVDLRTDAALPPGRYYLECSEPEGTVGWWSRPDETNANMTAYVDGKPTTGFRQLYVYGEDPEELRILDFFTFRAPSAGGYLKKTNPNGAWSWLENYPQDLHHGPDGEPEMMSVSVAQNSGENGMQPMSEPGAMGRRFHKGANDQDPRQLALGPNFQEQWNRALEVDPPLVFVTGWNEWIMSRIRDYHQWKREAGNFVDQFTDEFSRDAEPMRGGFGDAYYWQLVANIRRYKGARSVPRVTSRPVEIDGSFADWAKVTPEYRDTPGDPMRRDHPGFGHAGPYVDKTGRNDIVAAKVSRVSDGVCFYVRTREALVKGPSENWMLLFIDADANAATGEMGYELVIRPGSPESGVKVARGVCELELKVPAKCFPNGRVPATFDFKWADNCLEAHDWTDFTLHGDAAPNDRYNYRVTF